MSEGFLAVDKPSGPTSHDIVDRVRRITGIKKVGHAGTLDPLATGVLVLGVARATRLLRFLQDSEKEYRAEVAFGVATDTLDAQGEVIHRQEMSFSQEDLVEATAAFLGRIDQVPPMVSAVKVGGRRLYALAREGKEVERPPRQVEVFSIEVEDFRPGSFPVAVLRVVCGSGTYVRTLADDLARSLGGRAHLTALRRERVGSLSTPVPPEDLDSETWREHLIAPAVALAHLPELVVDEGGARAVSHGRRLEIDPGPSPSGLVRVTDRQGRLLAVYRTERGSAVPEVVLS